MTAQALSTVPPGASFRVAIGVRAPEARLVLLDGQGAWVPATGSAEVGSETTYELRPSDLLRPGALYELRLEGSGDRTVRDANGQGYEPLSFRVQVSGKPEPPPPRRKPGRRHKGSP